MYDTLHLRLSKEEAGGDLFHCLSSLSHVAETYKADGQTYITGNLNNYRVTVSDYGISLKGSLPKLYFGDNLHTLTRSDSKRAFEMLSDTLCLPIQRATVTRIDIAQNLIVKYKPEAYFPYLGHSNYYQRLVQPKSIYYNNTQRVKLFYNKIAESKRHDWEIPQVLQNQHVLRYELRYMQRLNKQLKLASITPQTLIDESFYMSLIDQWAKEYESIQKTALIKMDLNNIRTLKDYLNQIITLTIQEKGLDAFLHHVDLLKEQKTFDKPEYYSRLRSRIKQLAKSTSLANTPELVEELNRKVNRVKQSYR
ncbi:phage/plasmid replication domain-containing protein [Adhaeribacter aquaticus]|uniref:phage/plasmid replication domain-containing protein n=1 Tax=Adhaeribacter aquaticus TaxID=299567 RepID=UPI00040A509E|nr:phage/plasmid replication protein [Adhaeribacter aquaticus]